MSGKKKILIIGGGVAGMSAGIYAQVNGFDSVVVEKHSIPGGICTAWYRKHYKFDYSIQWLVGTKEGAFHDTMWETGILDDTVKVLNSDVHNINVDKNGADFIIFTKVRRWRRYLLRMAPEDFIAINRLCRDIRWASHLRPFDIAPALRKPWHYVKALYHCWPSLYMALRHKGKTYQEYIDSLHFKNEYLRSRMLQIYGENNFSAYAFLLIMGWYLRKNAGYPMGGSLGVAERMQKKYESLGGQFLFKKEVEEIIIENNQAKGVRLTDGTVLEADYVISAADGYATLFNMLKGKYNSKEIENAYKNWHRFSSIVQVSFGVNKKLETGSHIQVVLAQNEKIGSTTISHSYRVLNYDFDSSMAPENKTAIVFRFESPYELWENMTDEEYKAEKQKIAEDARKLLEKHYPGSLELVEVMDVATPRTTIRYTGAWKGAYEGFMPTPKNVIDQLDQKLPNLDHFYMAGQWLFPGGGIPPSVESGKWAIQLICRDEDKRFHAKQRHNPFSRKKD